MDNQKDANMTKDMQIFEGISEAAVWKIVGKVTKYLDLSAISPNSIKKRSIERIFEASGYDEEIINEFMQQGSTMTDQILSKIDGKERNRNRIFM